MLYAALACISAHRLPLLIPAPRTLAELHAESGFSGPYKPVTVKTSSHAPQYLLAPPSPTASESTAASTVAEWRRPASSKGPLDMQVTATRMNLHVQQNNNTNNADTKPANQEGIQPTR